MPFRREYALEMVGAGCCAYAGFCRLLVQPSLSCPETDATKLAPFIMPGPADIGRTFRMRGLLLSDWEEALFTRPVPASSSKARMIMRYCFKIDDSCVWKTIRRLAKTSSPLAAGIRVDVVVEFLGESANSDCWLGEVRIVGII